MRLMLAVLALFLLGLTQDLPASSCFVYPTWEESMEKSDAVFVGRVASISSEELELDWNNFSKEERYLANNLFKAGMINARKIRLVTWKVDVVWKGPLSRFIQTLEYGAGSELLEQGDSWVLVGHFEKHNLVSLEALVVQPTTLLTVAGSCMISGPVEVKGKRQTRGYEPAKAILDTIVEELAQFPRWIFTPEGWTKISGLAK